MSGPNIAELEVRRLTFRKQKFRKSQFEYTAIGHLDHLRNLADAAGSCYDLWKSIRRLGFIPPNSFADKCPYFTQAINNPACIKFNRHTAAILDLDNQGLISTLERLVAGHTIPSLDNNNNNNNTPSTSTSNTTITEPSSTTNTTTTETLTSQSESKQQQQQPRTYTTGRTRKKPTYPIRDATMVSPVKSVILVNIALVYLLFNAEFVAKMF